MQGAHTAWKSALSCDQLTVGRLPFGLVKFDWEHIPKETLIRSIPIGLLLKLKRTHSVLNEDWVAFGHGGVVVDIWFIQSEVIIEREACARGTQSILS